MNMTETTARPMPGAALRPLSGRVALVTGSTSGIGLGILQQLAAAGADVVMNGLGDMSRIEGELERIRDAHGIATSYAAADLTDAGQCRGMVETVQAQHGRLDILVNNAGIQHVAPVETFPVEKWDAILALNLSAAFHAIAASLAGMKARGWGRIINVASAHALVASPFKSAYVAAKHGIVGLTKTVALESAESGVTANAICPGYVWTPLVEQQIEGQAKAHNLPRERVIREVLLAKQPNRRFAQSAEIGALAVFLASDAAQSITGAALPVDGGWTAQ